MSATIIAIQSNKGGSTKTSSCIAISSYLSQKGFKVLVVDADAQKNTSLVLLNQVEDLPEEQTVALLLKDDLTELNKAVWKTSIPNLDVIPSHSRLSEAEVVLSQLMAREERMKFLLRPLRERYDFIFIDNPPNTNFIPINSLVAADYVLIPITPNAFDLSGINLTLEAMKRVQRFYNPKLKLLGLMMSLFDHRNSISHEIYSLLQQQFGDLLFNTKIPINTAIQKANAHRQDIFTYEPTSTGAIAYKSFIEKELLPKLLKLKNEENNTK